MSLTRQDYINYLVNEAKRQLQHTHPLFYPNLYVFLKSQDGLDGFELFKKLNPRKIGITTTRANNFKRMFDE
jgi:hypothetical protein